MVDCDLRNPSLSANLAANAGGGIIDVLPGARSLDVAVLGIPGHGKERPRGADRGRMARQDRVIHISFGFGGILGCAKGRAQAACYSDSNNSLPGFP